MSELMQVRSSNTGKGKEGGFGYKTASCTLKALALFEQQQRGSLFIQFTARVRFVSSADWWHVHCLNLVHLTEKEGRACASHGKTM